jgi:protein phosphatase
MVRTHNEDAYAVAADDGLVVVADGMGGYSAGEVASRLAVDSVVQRLQFNHARRTGDDLEDAFQEANQVIWDTAGDFPEMEGMGTTMVVGLIQDQSLLYAWVGDSRLYRLREGQLGKLTIDHTLVQDLVDKGVFDSVEDAMAAGVRDNVLTRALGSEPWVAVSFGVSELRDGDIYLFCTDGLSHMVPDMELGRALRDGIEDLDLTAERLVELAYAAGALDNITLVLMRIGQSSGTPDATQRVS